MASEDSSAAALADIQGEDKPSDSLEINEPGEEIPDFIDEIEAQSTNVTANATVPLST